jgi:hypothetical protein
VCGKGFCKLLGSHQWKETYVIIQTSFHIEFILCVWMSHPSNFSAISFPFRPKSFGHVYAGGACISSTGTGKLFGKKPSFTNGGSQLTK